MKTNSKEKRERRHARIRARVIGTQECPRLSVFRSNSHIYAQLIDDGSGKTLASVSDIKMKRSAKQTKIALAKEIGAKIAKEAATLKISKVVFDRAGYAYHGNVKALAEGARAGGLQF